MKVESSGPSGKRSGESRRQDTRSETCCDAQSVREDCEQGPAAGSLRAGSLGQMDVPTSSTVGMSATGEAAASRKDRWVPSGVWAGRGTPGD